jgi:hypothetical protein
MVSWFFNIFCTRIYNCQIVVEVKAQQVRLYIANWAISV